MNRSSSFSSVVATTVAFVALAAAAQDARAADPPVGASPASSPAPTSSGPSGRPGDLPISAEARRHFEAGVALLRDPAAPRYEEAYREFKAAYAASPSYKILGNLGLCSMKIERDSEAITAYQTYLDQGGTDLDPQEREQIQRDLLVLQTGVVHVTVSSDPPGASLSDVRTPVRGIEIRNAYDALTAPVTLGLRRGHHVLTAKLAGYADQTWEFDGNESILPAHVFTMVPVATAPVMVRERPIPTSAYVVGSIALALAVGGGVTGTLALTDKSKYNSENNGKNFDAANSERSTVLTLNHVTDGLLGGAVVGAIVAVSLVIARPTVERPASSEAYLPVHVTPFWLPATREGGDRAPLIGLQADWVF